MPIWKQHGQSDADEGKNQKMACCFVKWAASLSYDVISVDRQLWPSVKCELCCSMATLPELESVLLPFYWKMLPLGGDCSDSPKRDPTTGLGILWHRPPTSKCRGNSGAVKQTAYALRLLHCHGYRTPNIPWTPTCRIGGVIPTPPIILC
jgi:hypothetical protein